MEAETLKRNISVNSENFCVINICVNSEGLCVIHISVNSEGLCVIHISGNSEGLCVIHISLKLKTLRVPTCTYVVSLTGGSLSVGGRSLSRTSTRHTISTLCGRSSSFVARKFERDAE